MSSPTGALDSELRPEAGAGRVIDPDSSGGLRHGGSNGSKGSRFPLWRRGEVCPNPGDVEQGCVLIVVGASDDRGGGSLVCAGEVLEDIEVESRVAALGLKLIQRQLRKGKGYDDALDGRHADKRQALHGAERFNGYTDEVGRMIVAMSNAITHPAECHRDRILNEEGIRGGILHRTRGLVPHRQSPAIDVKPANFQVQIGLRRERQREIRQGLIDGSRQQQLFDRRPRRPRDLLLEGTAGNEQ